MGTVVFIRERRSHGKRYIKAAISEIPQRNISLPLLFVQKQQSCGGSFAGNFFKSTAFTAGFISLLSYLRDHQKIVKILNGDQEIPYDTMLESVKQDGLRIYGFSIVCQKEKLLQLRDEEEISYLYAVPLD